MMKVTLDDIRRAATAIAPHVRRTPLIEARAVSEPPTPARLWLKLENLQATGSFKARGAMNKLSTLPRDAIAHGVVTASGGNHGLATTHAAVMAGVRATIFVPDNIAPYKADRLRSMGAELIIKGSIWNETNQYATAFAEETGAAYFHPFADPAVVAGQGTLALEILEDNPDLDSVLIAIGGGGLISGMAVALKALKPAIRIVGVEPVGCPTFHASVAAGQVVRIPEVTTKVATMACAETDAELFAMSRSLIDEFVLIEDDDMLSAAQWLWTQFGLATDLSGAAATAALRTGHVTGRAGEHICALVCGSGTEGIAGKAPG